MSSDWAVYDGDVWLMIPFAVGSAGLWSRTGAGS